MSEEAIDARIDLFLTELRMPSIRRSYRKIGKQVAQHGGDYIAYLHSVLEEEVNDRRARRIDRRIQEARLPQPKELGQLQADALPKGVSLAQIFDLAKGDYLRERTNIIAIGGSVQFLGRQSSPNVGSLKHSYTKFKIAETWHHPISTLIVVSTIFHF